MKTLLVVFILFIGTFSQASETCNSEKYTPSNISDRTRVVHFPDGRQLIIVGHNHGDRSSLKNLISALTKSTLGTSTAAFEESLNSILKGNETAVLNQQENILFMKSLFANKSNLKFVAEEDDEENNRQLNSDIRNVGGFLYSNLAARNLLQKISFQNMMLLTFGSGLYLRATEPSLLKDTKTIGVESVGPIEEEARAYNKVIALTNAIYDKNKDNPDFLGKLNFIRGDIFSKYAIYDSKKHDQIILEDIKSMVPPKYLAATSELIQADLDRMKATKKRDLKVAENLAATQESGILLIGRNHLESVANNLVLICKAEASRSTSSATKTRSVR